MNYRTTREVFLFFFFFQAEDGIRDGHVTGVQTCALPIFPGRRRRLSTLETVNRAECAGALLPEGWDQRRWNFRSIGNGMTASDRSEERRVGKECRSRWSRDH